MTPRANLVLVGFMGVGKSAVGRELARRMHRTLLDMDAEIEHRAGRTIADIFAQQGEPAFRAMERELAREVSGRENLIIACGGGVVLQPDNLADLSRTGLIFCLTATAEAVLDRVSRAHHRPLLAGEDRDRRVRELMEKRRPLYAAIPLQIDTTQLTPAEAADLILAEFDYRTGSAAGHPRAGERHA